MKNIAYLSLVLLSLTSAAQTPVYPYSDGHRWGLINANLQVIAPPQFDTSVFFGRESFAIAIKNKKYGVIGSDGKNLIDFNYYRLDHYQEEFGRGYTRYDGYTKEGYPIIKFVLLNLATGKVVSPVSYDVLWDYCDCPDKVFSIRKDTQTVFVSGITGKQLGKGYGPGEVLFLPEQRGSGNKAIVQHNGQYGVIDAMTGAWIVPAQYEAISQTYRHNQITVEAVAKGVKQYFDYNGKPIQKPKPQPGSSKESTSSPMVMEAAVPDQQWYAKDLYVRNLGDGNWKLTVETRGTGNNQVHQTYELKGYTNVEKVAYYDEQHKLPALLKAVKDGKTGIVDLSGNVLVPFMYDNIESLKVHNFYLQTSLNNKIGVLRRDLTELSKPVMKQVMADEPRLKDWYVEMPNGYRGYMDVETGKIFIPGESDLLFLKRQFTNTNRNNRIGPGFVAHQAREDRYYIRRHPFFGA
ncbi:WG repeat-containing protein [Paraflavitalea pollutisoli]|uniref:WG repeat-containing protein n=1 Tax=Paraflavitalea pollutisoli TaxID=3034143 RepID=UPI0023EB657E|nr:WG repeat-containing protein [Paraflavitalea sp. H1-2-19X]